MACFDPCSLPSSSSESQRNRNDSFNSSSDKSYHGSSSNRHGGRLASTPQQQALSPIASCKPAALQLLQLLCNTQPSAVAELLSRDSLFLCSCLTASPSTAAAWFGQFSLAGIQHFKHGARALANYALTHRSEVWQYLVWAGKHDQVRCYQRCFRTCCTARIVWPCLEASPWLCVVSRCLVQPLQCCGCLTAGSHCCCWQAALLC
jgi:hypothetical protein